MNPWKLSPQTADVLDGIIALGKYKLVARHLNISSRTVEYHMARAKKAMGDVGKMAVLVEWQNWNLRATVPDTNRGSAEFNEWYKKASLRQCTDFEMLVRAWDHQQARIDELMMEYCPDEMTQEQVQEYNRSQVVIKDVYAIHERRQARLQEAEREVQQSA